VTLLVCVAIKPRHRRAAQRSQATETTSKITATAPVRGHRGGPWRIPAIRRAALLRRGDAVGDPIGINRPWTGLISKLDTKTGGDYAQSIFQISLLQKWGTIFVAQV
jgi:hypothetical protein